MILDAASDGTLAHHPRDALIVWAQLPGPDRDRRGLSARRPTGARPASRAPTDAGRAFVTVVPVSSNSDHRYPFQVLLPASGTGLDRDSKARAEQLRLQWRRACRSACWSARNRTQHRTGSSDASPSRPLIRDTWRSRWPCVVDAWSGELSVRRPSREDERRGGARLTVRDSPRRLSPSGKQRVGMAVSGSTCARVDRAPRA